ncbi:MAG TPA: CPXCG motif-containing cysteine-rich protein [Gammaproteobacteria bacterium]|nr:CPXCG motif-containing cysteine-rich protein [Gammaproteobacteria bacterium]MDP7661611.1 CPXCG motif-containing cysteine-rich protein [Gammaproteobacteria bacterium]HJP39010.1 CPXCG motif-containing cysteine-rich protein [Gammaproteobacteria bacterium]
MSALSDATNISCPYCGEIITLVVDLSVAEQDYIEDCFVCCRPIRVICRADGGSFTSIEATTTDD